MSRLHRHWLAESLTALLWILPLMIPYAVGLWWLWKQDQMLVWLAAVLGVSLVLALIGRLTARVGHSVEVLPPDEYAADAEKRSRQALNGLVASAAAADVSSAKDTERLVRRVLTAVAEAWNPGASSAELRFTLPEALALTEHIAARLRVAIREDLPALQHVQIAHALHLQRGIKPARGLWNAYRAGRFLFNPVGSVVAELRRGVLMSLTPLAVESVKTKAAALLARETGEAAILLYSGRLRREVDRLESDSPVPKAEPEAGPLTFLVAGKANAGKSSLINALSGRERARVSPLPCAEGFTAYVLEQETAGELIFVDSPGIDGPPSRDGFREADRADLILWVAAAHRADRAADQRALRAFRAQSEADRRRRQAPILLVLTHADRLDPAPEWDPPYDPDRGERPKEQSIRAARDAAARALDVPAGRVIPVSVRNPESAWNLDAFWRTVHQHLPAARRARLERLLQRRSRMDGVRDAARTFPGLLKQIKKSL